MPNTPPPSAPAEASFTDFMRDLWRARLYIAGGALCGGLALFGVFASAVPQYRATMIIGPVMSAAAPEIAPLEFALFESGLRGPSMAEKILEDDDLRDGLAQSRRWRFGGAEKTGDVARLADYLSRRVHIVPVGETKLRRVSYTHQDAGFAVSLLRRLYVLGDLSLRADASAKVAARIAEITAQMNAAENPVHRRALTDDLIAQEQLALTLARSQPYAALLAEPPAASPRPVWPARALMAVVFIFAGMFGGGALFHMRRTWP